MAMESVVKISLPPPKSKANDAPLSLKSNKKGGVLEERFVHHAVSFFVPFVIFVVKPSCLKSRLHTGADIQTRLAPQRPRGRGRYFNSTDVQPLHSCSGRSIFTRRRAGLYWMA